MNASNAPALLRVENLKKYYPVYEPGFFRKQRGVVRAVDGISFEIFKGRTLGLVGESGCGKSTAARTILQLQRATEGKIFFDRNNLCELSSKQLRPLRKHFQMIFQDPYASLNPRMKIAQIVEEPLEVHRLGSRGERREKVIQLLRQVGLDETALDRFPHEFSGGQKQRIGIARALATRPRLILCDEPVSALDVSIRAQIINLLQQLQQELQIAYLFIAHDLSVVYQISDDVAVMYLGKIVEKGPKEQIFRRPLHPYTQALFEAIPVADPEIQKMGRKLDRGEAPSPENPPPGCAFHPRCPIAVSRCREEIPLLEEKQPGHWAACHLVE